MTLQTILTDEQVEKYTAAGQWTGRVITDFLDEVAAARPDTVAAIDSRGQRTWAELKRLSDRAAIGRTAQLHVREDGAGRRGGPRGGHGVRVLGRCRIPAVRLRVSPESTVADADPACA